MKKYFLLSALLLFSNFLFAFDTIIEIKPDIPSCVIVIYDDDTTVSLEDIIEAKEKNASAGYTKYSLNTTKKVKDAKAANADCVAKNIEVKIIRLRPLTLTESFSCWLTGNCPDNEILLGEGPLGGGGVENKLPPSNFFNNSRLVLVNESLTKNATYKQFGTIPIIAKKNIPVVEQQKMAPVFEKKGIALENVNKMTSLRNKNGQNVIAIEMKDGQQFQLLPSAVNVGELKLPSQQMMPR